MPILWEGEFNPIRGALGVLERLLGEGGDGSDQTAFRDVARSHLGLEAMAPETFALLERLPRLTTVFRTVESRTFLRNPDLRDAHATTSYDVEVDGEWLDTDDDSFPLADVAPDARFQLLIRVRTDRGAGPGESRVRYTLAELVQILNHELHVHGLEFAAALRRMTQDGLTFASAFQNEVAGGRAQHRRFVREPTHRTIRSYRRARARFRYWTSQFMEDEHAMQMWSAFRTQERQDLAQVNRGLDGDGLSPAELGDPTHAWWLRDPTDDERDATF